MPMDAMAEELLELLKISSPSGREGALAGFLSEKLSSMGFQVAFDEAAGPAGSEVGNLIARLPGDGALRPIAICCHMDNVEPCEGVVPVLDGDVIRSSGQTVLGADDKAGIALALELSRRALRFGGRRGDLELVFTVVEEKGLRGSKHLDLSMVKSQHFLVLDSSGPVGDVIVRGPAQDRIEARVLGRAAHAGLEPEKGVSAIVVAARAISEMRLGRVDEITTANVGVIRGGVATNIVAPEVHLEAEARSLDEGRLKSQTEHMVLTLREVASRMGGEAEVRVERMYPSFSLSPEEEPVRTLVEAFKLSGLEARLRGSGGGSDANVLNGRGRRAVNLSIGVSKPHSKEESVDLRELGKAVFALEAFLRLWWS